MKKLKIQFNAKTFYARLLTEQAPQTIARLEACGPFDSLLVAAKMCDHEIQWHTPMFYAPLENPVFDQKPGNVIYYPQRQCICVFYGETMPVNYCNLIAEILPEDLPGFFQEAQTVWSRQGGLVHTQVVEE